MGDLLSLVEELARVERIGVTRLARQLGVPAATAHRMLRVLERRGFVEQLPDSKEYRLTLKLFELGCQVASRTTLRDVATLEIERLAHQTGLPASFGILVQDEVLYLAQVQSEGPFTINLRPGTRAPATCTAMGKAMLSVEARPVRDLVGGGPYPGRTQNSITGADALVLELAEVQRLGYAVDREELSLGLCCVAAPVLGVRQAQQGAVSVAVFGRHLEPPELERLGKLVITCATRLSHRIGDLEDFHSWSAVRASYPRP
ncbi:MAG TPA: IclR family transcriptional regulator [Acidimicrobiales bacterium]|nr:IclR family transcriptional regulator [Acidimicrobiales bacterium]